MKVRVCVGLSVFLFIGAVLARAKEGEPFGTISQEELKMTSEPLAPGAPAIILYRQVDRDDTQAQSWERNYRRIKILTEAGLKYANVEIPYIKGNGRGIKAIKARTVKPDGTIVNFDEKVLTKEIVSSKGVKQIVKTFTLPDVQVGSIIEYSYIENFAEQSSKGVDVAGHSIITRTDKAIGTMLQYSFAKGPVEGSRWILSDELFTKLARFSLMPLQSTNHVLRWSTSRLPEGTKPPKATGSDMIRMEAKNIPAFSIEDFMPPANELKSRVDFIYGEKLVEIEPDKYWRSKTRIWNSGLDTFIGKRKAMEEAVRQIVSPDDSKEVKLQKIYARVQQLRNTSYEVEKSEKEQEKEREQEKLKDIDNVEDIWNRGSGDEIQLNWLFLGLVRAAGFDAYGVWTASRKEYFFDKGALDEKKLNANVVLVKLDGKDFYFDPGSAFTPYGMLPWEETAVPGRLMDKEGGTWVSTSIPDASLSRIERKGDFRVNKAGDLEGTLTMTLTGLEAARARQDKRQDNDTDRKKFLEDMLKEQIPSAGEVQLTNKPEWRSSSPSMIAEFSVRIPGWMSVNTNKFSLPVGIFAGGEKNVFVANARKHPIYFEYPSSKQDDVQITLPTEWKVGKLPEPQNVGDSSMLYTFKAEKDGSTVHLKRTLKIGRVLWDKGYYSALRSFFQSVRIGDEQQVILQPVGLSSSATGSGD